MQTRSWEPRCSISPQAWGEIIEFEIIKNVMFDNVDIFLWYISKFDDFYNIELITSTIFDLIRQFSMIANGTIGLHNLYHKYVRRVSFVIAIV